MRRSLCYCSPSYALAGQVTTWKFAYTPSSNLPKGAQLKFDLLSNGREIDWQVPSVNLKDKANVIYAALPDGKVLAATEVDNPESYVPQYLFTLPADLKAGEEFAVMLGAPPKSKDEATVAGNACQTTVQRRRPFFLYIDPKGKGNYEDPEVFTLDIRGNELHTIRVLTPSFVLKNKRFDVTVRFEDQFGNLTSHAPEDTLIELTYEQLRENLNWKLFVPETGFLTLPNLYFNEEGVYTIELRNLTTGQSFKSCPIKCFNDYEKQLFWGLLHGESDRVDSTENVEACMRHFRDEQALNFLASSCFESQEETPNEIWKLISQNITDFNEDDRFTTLLGFQWYGQAADEGLRHFIYAKEGKGIMRQKEAKYASLKKLYKTLAPKEAISIPSFSMGGKLGCNFDSFTPEFERVVEIYNAWGSSECTAKEGNVRPIHSPSQSGIKESAEGSLNEALRKNHRFGFVAGGLDDRGVFADFFDSDQDQYSPGLTGIVADAHSRSALFDALYQRSCYATTGKRIIVGLSLAGIPMGSEVTTDAKPGLIINRHLAGFVAGTTDIDKVEIMRNGELLHTLKIEGYHGEFTYDDMDPLEKVALPGQVAEEGEEKQSPFAYYYVRVTQKDGHMAWSSPIWVDLTSEGGARKATARRGRGRPTDQ